MIVNVLLVFKETGSDLVRYHCFSLKTSSARLDFFPAGSIFSTWGLPAPAP